MARASRPPGFDMTYRPASTVSFGPPLKERIPSLVYLAVSLITLGVILYAQHLPAGSFLFRYIVEGDTQRMIPATTAGGILVVSAVASVLRTQMKGVVVHPDGIIVRELLALGWPRVKRLQWSQIDRLHVPAAAEARAAEKTLRLDLWDGSWTRLPRVADLVGLSLMLEKVALARAIPIEGGTGLIDEEIEAA